MERQYFPRLDLSDAYRNRPCMMPLHLLALLSILLRSSDSAFRSRADLVRKTVPLRQRVAVLKKKDPRPQRRWSNHPQTQNKEADDMNPGTCLGHPSAGISTIYT
jgi:hypothetical protein